MRSLFTNKRVSICHLNNLFVFTDTKEDAKISPIFANYGMRGASLQGVQRHHFHEFDEPQHSTSAASPNLSTLSPHPSASAFNHVVALQWPPPSPRMTLNLLIFLLKFSVNLILGQNSTLVESFPLWAMAHQPVLGLLVRSTMMTFLFLTPMRMAFGVVSIAVSINGVDNGLTACFALRV